MASGLGFIIVAALTTHNDLGTAVAAIFVATKTVGE